MDKLKLSDIDEGLESSDVAALCFLCRDVVNKKRMEGTALDVFAEMEKDTDLLSNTNLRVLHAILLQSDQQLALTTQRYMDGVTQLLPQTRSAHFSVDYQRVNDPRQPTQPIDVLMSETQPGNGAASVCPDAAPNIESATPPDHTDYYALTNKPRGLCVVINNEEFPGTNLTYRQGSQQDEKSLDTVFTHLGFNVVTHNNLTAGDMRRELQQLGSRNFLDDDALVVCVLSHGEKECVFGTDGQKVYLRELTKPFTSGGAPTLAGKPKLFFIQACQRSSYQRGSVPCPPRSRQEEDEQSRLEEDTGHVRGETVAWDADFLLGMATVPGGKSFRNTVTGSIYIQQLCAQLTRSAESPEKDDILTVLTRVNREVSRGEYLNYKQMPEPKYTLTKKLVLNFV